ncbi:hypothetical protein EMIHUDRAFT_455478 [Emiliania huxleyi CCMP1516]|uniref:CCT-beta n=2 Tax=Emiliania huxleyi TaxID=2903 RepID=A0A0D3KGH6_EMIH1|nr:hypothetical protein EMIHUDRAFT_455478 [Emiliania huxleyi CCMP1516]EOD34861.1 hypothetical protein EMIHUDRAFT_455478 [Emiliania huxleyi CCMP1516]|eukprot:XP_005787290.1 hypothetical protein EMIHUDRAFT_455478 [Emiliania huxleyi CCMP1516]
MMGPSLGPVNLFGEGSQEAKGEQARMSSIVGALAIADLVKTSLGPKGMDKILQSHSRGGSVSVTNDGATILKSVLIDNPAAKVLIDISKVQDDEVGDGTTSVCVLAGELLRQAAELIEKKMHPQVVIGGYRLARDAALKALRAAAIDHSDDEAAFRQDLLNIAMTTLSSKVLSQDKEHFAAIAVDAKIGVGCPKRMRDCKVMIANSPMDTDKVKIYGSKVKVDSVSKVAEIEAAEKKKMLDKVDKILAHGCNVFINRQLIYNLPEQRFADAGVMSIEHSDFDGTERLALVLDGDIVSTFDTPERVKLGSCAQKRKTGSCSCELIEEVMIGEDKLVRFSGCPNSQASSIVLRGANTHVAHRSLHDALCVLSQTVKNTAVLPGGGAPEMLMAQAVEEESKRVASKHVVAMEAYAKALRTMPMHIADNAGYDSTELCAGLKAKHHEGRHTWGLEMDRGGLGDMVALGICESLQVKEQVLLSSSEAAEMILRVDDIVQCAPRQRQQ